MSRNLSLGIAIGSVLVLIGAGCSRDTVIRGTVKGKVTLDGAPLTNASVFFESDETKTSMLCSLGSDGEFEFMTHVAKGLPVGTYKVAITPGGVMNPNDAPVLAGKNKSPVKAGPMPTIPEKYTSTATSGFTVEVKEGDNSPYLFPLKK